MGDYLPIGRRQGSGMNNNHACGHSGYRFGHRDDVLVRRRKLAYSHYRDRIFLIKRFGGINAKFNTFLDLLSPPLDWTRSYSENR